jgi:hypothetical protein
MASSTVRNLHVGISALAALCVPLIAAPIITPDVLTGHVGAVPAGERELVEYTFTLRNTGEDTLRIHEVRATCRCTETVFDSVIAPGKAGTLRQVVDIYGFTNGPFERSVQVLSNARNAPQLTLRVAGIGRGFVEIDRPQLRVLSGSEREAGAPETFARSPLKELRITEAEFVVDADHMAPWYTSLVLPLNWQLVPADRSDTSSYHYFTLNVWLPDTVPGSHQGTCLLRTNHPRQPTMSLPAILLPAQSAADARAQH